MKHNEIGNKTAKNQKGDRSITQHYIDI